MLLDFCDAIGSEEISYSGPGNRINLVFFRSLGKGGGGYIVKTWERQESSRKQYNVANAFVVQPRDSISCL